MRVLIVEDEPIAAAALQAMLVRLAPDLACEPVLDSVETALQRLAQAPLPHLVFLDVHLSDGLCFELFDAMPPTLPVIFTTAHDEFAQRAFEVFGIDYLLKPIRPETLRFSIDKWRALAGAGTVAPARTRELAAAYAGNSGRWRERFLVGVGQGWTAIAVEQIAYFHKALVTTLCTRERRVFAIDHSLDELERMLDPARFFRVNRQLLVQVDAIAEIHRGSKGRLDLVLRPPSDAAATVSQERAAAFRAWLDR